MKTLGLCLLFLSFVPLASGPARAQSDGLALNTNKDAIQKWLARKAQSSEGYQVILPPQDNNFVISLDELEPGCMYMRTYRVKREARDSDVTRPAGYTTCVPMGRFTMKSAVIRSDESELGQNAPAR
jgi:hypothetical protein